MKVNLEPRHFRARLPVFLGDDLQLSIRSGAEGVRLSPQAAVVLGCRLIRQAAVIDTTLVAPATSKRTAKTPRAKQQRR